MGHQHQHHQRATAASNTATVLLIRLNGHPSSLFVRRSFSFWSDMCPPFVSIEQGSIDHTTLVHSVAILNGCLFSNSRWRWYSPRWSSSIWIIAHRPTNQYVDHTCVSYIPSYSNRAHTHKLISLNLWMEMFHLLCRHWSAVDFSCFFISNCFLIILTRFSWCSGRRRHRRLLLFLCFKQNEPTTKKNNNKKNFVMTWAGNGEPIWSIYE